MDVFSFKIITVLDIFRTLPGILGDIDAAEDVQRALVFAAWRRIAGDGLVEHAVPVGLEDGILSIAVAGVSWQRHMRDLRGQMVFKVNAVLGMHAVSAIELIIDEVAVLQARKAPIASGIDFEVEAAKQISPELSRAADNIE